MKKKQSIKDFLAIALLVLSMGVAGRCDHDEEVRNAKERAEFSEWAAIEGGESVTWVK